MSPILTSNIISRADDTSSPALNPGSTAAIVIAVILCIIMACSWRHIRRCFRRNRNHSINSRAIPLHSRSSNRPASYRRTNKRRRGDAQRTPSPSSEWPSVLALPGDPGSTSADSYLAGSRGHRQPGSSFKFSSVWPTLTHARSRDSSGTVSHYLPSSRSSRGQHPAAIPDPNAGKRVGKDGKNKKKVGKVAVKDYAPHAVKPKRNPAPMTATSATNASWVPASVTSPASPTGGGGGGGSGGVGGVSNIWRPRSVSPPPPSTAGGGGSTKSLRRNSPDPTNARPPAKPSPSPPPTQNTPPPLSRNFQAPPGPSAHSSAPWNNAMALDSFQSGATPQRTITTEDDTTHHPPSTAFPSTQRGPASAPPPVDEFGVPVPDFYLRFQDEQRARLQNGPRDRVRGRDPGWWVRNHRAVLDPRGAAAAAGRGRDGRPRMRRPPPQPRDVFRRYRRMERRHNRRVGRRANMLFGVLKGPRRGD